MMMELMTYLIGVILGTVLGYYIRSLRLYLYLRRSLNTDGEHVYHRGKFWYRFD